MCTYLIRRQFFHTPTAFNSVDGVLNQNTGREKIYVYLHALNFCVAARFLLSLECDYHAEFFNRQPRNALSFSI